MSFRKFPGGRLQVCYVDRLLRYGGEPPQVWVRYDKENAEVSSVPVLPENRTEQRRYQSPGPRLVGIRNPSTSNARQRSHKKMRQVNVRVTQPARDHDKKQIGFKRAKN